MAVNPETLHSILAEKLEDSLVGELPSLTSRDIRGNWSFPGKATAVIGMRRAGKTTFLHQIRRQRAREGVRRDLLPYVNFEDERLSRLEADQLHILLEEFERRNPRRSPDERVLWCLDEIQVIAGWERFVRRLLDTDTAEIVLSGSSAALLSREIATSMRGRAWEVLIHPFSFRESLRHKGFEVPARSDSLSQRKRAEIENAFLQYLVIGGFPEAQGLDTDSRHRLLRDYVDVAMFRDVVERHGVSNLVGLRWMVRHLLGNAAGAFSIEKFFAALKSQGVQIAKDTVHQLLGYLEDCFLVRTVAVEAESERRKRVNPRKAYPIDPGLIPVYDRTDRANLGHALETVVMLELERRGAEVTYVRTPLGREVDFLSRDAQGRSELIQVCADATAPEVAERETRALEEAGQLFPKAVLRLLTLTRDRAPRVTPRGVVVQPAYEWLLETPEEPRKEA